MTNQLTTEDIGFEPLFYLLDLNRNELRSMAIEKIHENGYEGVSFMEWNTGWSINPVKIGKGFISLGQFDFTENLQEAINHAKIR